jgi:hypothetical protein
MFLRGMMLEFVCLGVSEGHASFWVDSEAAGSRILQNVCACMPIYRVPHTIKH